MSILNVSVSPALARVAVDTRCIALDGRRGEGSKLVPLVHLNAVFAMRGPLDFLGNVYCCCSTHPANLDQLLEAMPDALQHCYERQFAGAAEDTFSPIQFVVAGWSIKQQRMVAMDYLLDTLGGTFSLRKQIDPWTLAPGERGTAPTKSDLASADLVEIATAQTRHALAANPSEGIGGRLLIAEITRDALTLTSHALS
jgi:hypothetical protein